MSIQTIKDNSQGLVTKIIVGFIVFTFAIFGVDAIINFSNSDKPAATVNGVDISESQVLRTSELYKRQMLNRMGDNADPGLINEQQALTQATEALIERQLLVEEATEQGIKVAEQRVDQAILSNEDFQANGVFDRATYEYRLRNAQLSPLDYKNQLTLEFLIQQPQMGLTRSAFITPAEIEQLTRLDLQVRDLAYLTVKADELSADITVTDADARAYYKANQADFMSDETLSIEYLELKRADFAADIAVDEAEIKQRYEQEISNLSDREARRASHILISIDEHSESEAQALLTEIQAKLAAGEDFSSLAKSYSDDPVSAENGGELEFAEKGTYVAPFEEVLFSLSTGETSDVVETEFGLHLIRLDAVRAAEIPALADIRDRLEKELKLQKAEEAFVSAVEELQNDSFSAGDLYEPASNQGLSVQTSKFFARSGGEGIAANDKVVRTAFSEELLTEGNNSDLIELTRDHVVVIRVKKHRPSMARPFEEVAERINQRLAQRIAQQNAQQLGELILVDLRNGKSLAEVSNDYGLTVTHKNAVKRNEPGLSSKINRHVFMMPKPADQQPVFSSLIQDNGNFVVIALTNVTDGDFDSRPAQEIKMISQFLSAQIGQQDFSEFLGNLHARAEIERF